jgi:putative flippase GtrA
MALLTGPFGDARAARTAGTFWTLVRHQLGAGASAIIDFGVMIVGVQGAGLTPVEATALGASVGAASNFVLGRAWIFRRRWGGLGSQVIRYGVVSAASAIANVLGEHLVHDVMDVQYVVARTLVSIVVSLTWNFPMQRRFVFREGTSR